jgi:hypothetical protein
MQKKIVALILFAVCTVSYGQIGGKYVYQFLNLVTSPRQAALGGKTITIYDEDVNQAHFNPATINSAMDNHLALNYGSYFGEVTYGTASYAYKYDERLQTIQTGINYVNYGKFDGYDENGQSTAQFTGSEIALSFGYAYNVPNSNLFIGANGKLISSSLERYYSFGGALDIGAVVIDEKNDLNWALVIRNIGTSFTTYSGFNEKLPLEIMAGVSQELDNVPVRWHLTLDNLQQWNISFSNPAQAQTSLDGSTTEKKVSFLGNAMRHVIFGVELFPKRSFNIQMSYNFRRSQELKLLEQRTFSGISVGFGLKLNKLKFNYSYSKYTLAGNTSLFGLTINFND